MNADRVIAYTTVAILSEPSVFLKLETTDITSYKPMFKILFKFKNILHYVSN